MHATNFLHGPSVYGTLLHVATKLGEKFGLPRRESMIAKDFLGCAGWAALVLLAAVSVPIAGPFISLLTPVPFLYYATKRGLQGGLALSAGAVLGIGVLARLLGQPQLILFVIEFSTLGLALSEIFRRRYSLGLTLVIGTACMLAIGIAGLFFIGIARNMGPFEVIQAYLKSNLQGALQMYEQMGMDKQKALEIQAYGKAIVETLSKLYPSLMVVGSVFVVWINVLLGRRLLRLANFEYPHYGYADRWQAPEILVWGIIAAGFSLFFPWGSVKLIAVNVLIVLMTVYLFQGVSILLFFLNKYHVPPWIRGAIYLLLFFQQVFLLLVALAGVFDQWIDFRKIHRRLES